MNFRVEKDAIGEINVPNEKLWGPQTQRSLENFDIGDERIPKEIIKAFAILKRSAALANEEMGNLSKEKTTAIVKSCDEIIAGKLSNHFPLVTWQTGSGTQTHMNVNEVIANRGNQILQERNIDEIIHPNDDVNFSQSSNCNFPTAIYIASVTSIEDKLLPSMKRFKEVLLQKSKEYSQITKVGRTHLQDAVPLTLGQEISAWYKMIEKTEKMISESVEYMYELAFAGTAVGTGLNTFVGFDKLAIEKINEYTNKSFSPAANKFHSLTSYDEVVFTHGALKALGADLMKIANDVRWLASGPRSGIGEITIPSNEPGSSMMPGKINPTQPEALTMIATQIFGNDTTISVAASQGNFQVNVFKPVIGYNFIQSINLLTDGIDSFNKNCIQGMKPNYKIIEKNLKNSLMLVTVLNPHIGYDKASEIAKTAHSEDLTLKEAALQLGYLNEQEFDEIVNPDKMLQPEN